MKRELLVDPHYSSGCYFQEAARHAVDAPFKATSFIHLLRHVSDRYSLCIQSYADVGCGSGHVTTLVADALSALYEPLKVAKGYDVSPHVRHVQRDGIEFVHADFRASSEYFDLATLFDVFEHVPDPVGFIKGVAEQCDLIGFHVPLDANWNCFLRD